MLIRILDFPRPIVAACKGHGIGMGIFLLMVCDYRVGAEGAYKYSMPESRIGMDLGELLIALAKSRISPKYLTRMAVLSEDLDAQTAVDAGVLDEIVDAPEVQSRAMEIATGLATMPVAFGKNKRDQGHRVEQYESCIKGIGRLILHHMEVLVFSLAAR